jgi:hypothetical protein
MYMESLWWQGLYKQKLCGWTGLDLFINNKGNSQIYAVYIVGN